MKRQRGITYLWMLFLVFLLSLGLGKTLEIYSTMLKREKEAELIATGDQYRQAIKLYYLSSPGYVKKYPEKLGDLLKDPRHLTTRRYIRKLYDDPISGQPFTTITAPEGGIMGVASPSDALPIKQAGFSTVDEGFKGAMRYSAWQFVYSGEPAATKH